MIGNQKELMTFHGTTISGTLSGVITLSSDLLYTTTSGIQLPKGLSMKIWDIRITGPAATVQVIFQKTSGATVLVHDSLYHAWISGNSVPPMIVPMERPIIISSLAGTEFVQAAWTQNSSYGPTNVDIGAEFVDGM